MRTKRILSPLGAIVFALAFFQAACADNGTPTAELAITTASLPGGTVGVAYTQTLAATGGKAPYQWSLGAGQSLPAGLALSAAGVVSGSPTASGDFSVGVRVTDAGARTSAHTYAVTIAAGLDVTVPNVLPDGHQFSAYNFTLTATGGRAPYTWTIVGALPAGLSLSNGVISGAATVNGAFTFSIRCTDAAGAVVELPVMFNIMIPAISITSGPVPDGETNVAYSTAITAVGGGPPYSWTVSSGALPAGLTLTSGGVIAGTPSGSGASTFTLQVADGASNIQHASFTITVHAAVSVGTTTLSAGQKGTAYNALLGASGGVAPYDWTLVGGALPAGLTLAGSGSISGTPTATGASTFTLKLTDHLGGFASQNYSLTIAGPQVIITTPSLPDVEVGQPINRTMAASGTPPYAWSISSGALPAGVTMNSAGVISGAATAAGPVTVGILVTDGSGSTYGKSFFFMVQPPVAITTTSVAAGQVNQSYNQTLAATGGIGAYTWNSYGGSLPPGMILTAGGVLAGTPTSVGSWDIFVRALDGVGGFGTRALTIVINTQGLAIFTGSLPDCELEMVYNQQLVATGGAQPYSWSVESGSLFTGWTLSAAGVVHGNCGSSGSTTFTAKVTDASGATQTHAYTITLHPDVSITTTVLHDGQVGTSYNQIVHATNGVPPYAWSIHSGLLPSGLFLDPATGAVSGAPTAAGVYTAQIEVTDAMGVTDSKSYTITIVP
jgi:hypothetical protein